MIDIVRGFTKSVLSDQSSAHTTCTSHLAVITHVFNIYIPYKIYKYTFRARRNVYEEYISNTLNHII